LRFSIDDFRLSSGCRPFAILQWKIDNGLRAITPLLHWYRSKVFAWRKNAASVVEAMTLSKAQGARLKAQGVYPNAVPVSL
jgi:hypothetical protein